MRALLLAALLAAPAAAATTQIDASWQVKDHSVTRVKLSTDAVPGTGVDVTQAPYSAACDGATDDSAAIQACVNVSSTVGMPCQLPNKKTCVYGQASTNAHVQLVLKPGCSINGGGGTTLRFDTDGGGGGACGLATGGLISLTSTSGGSSTRKITNLTLKANKKNPGCIVNATAASGQVSDVTLDQNTFDDAAASTGTYGLVVGNVTTIVVTNNYFDTTLSRDIYDIGGFTNGVYIHDNFFDEMLSVSTQNVMVQLGTVSGAWNAGELRNNIFESGPNYVKVINGVGVTISNNYMADVNSPPSTGTNIDYKGFGGQITANYISDENSNTKLTGIKVAGDGNSVIGNSIDSALIALYVAGSGEVVKGNNIYFPYSIGVELSTGTGNEVGLNAEVGNFQGTGRFPYVCDASATQNTITTAQSNLGQGNYADSCLAANIVTSVADGTIQGLSALHLTQSLGVGVNDSSFTVTKAGLVGVGTNAPGNGASLVELVTASTQTNLPLLLDNGFSGNNQGSIGLGMRLGTLSGMDLLLNSGNNSPFKYGSDYMDSVWVNKFTGNMDIVTSSSMAFSVLGDNELGSTRGWGWTGIGIKGINNSYPFWDIINSTPAAGSFTPVWKVDVMPNNGNLHGAGVFEWTYGSQAPKFQIQVNNNSQGDFQYGGYGDVNLVQPNNDKGVGTVESLNLCAGRVCPVRVLGGDTAGTVRIGSGTYVTFSSSGDITIPAGSSFTAPGNSYFGAAPTVSTFSATGALAMGAALNLASHLINNVTDPASAQDAATKNYVDNNVNGLDYKAAARVAATAALPSNAYANGSSGVGATLTGLALGTLTIDGVTPAVNDRVLVNNEASPSHNGLYAVTVNAGGAFYVLTRTTDFNTASEMASGVAVFVTSGTTNIDTGWVTTSSVTTVGTDPITFVQFTGLGDVVAGTGLSKSGNTLNLANTAVGAGSYTNTSLTVDAQGRITSASSGVAGGETNTFTSTKTFTQEVQFSSSIYLSVSGSSIVASNLSLSSAGASVPALNMNGGVVNISSLTFQTMYVPVGSTATAQAVGYTVAGVTITPTAYPLTDWYSLVASTLVVVSTNQITFAVDMSSGIWELEIGPLYGVSSSTGLVKIQFAGDSSGDYSSVQDNGVNGPWNVNFNSYCFMVDNDSSGRYRMSSSVTHPMRLVWQCENTDFNVFECHGSGTAYDTSAGTDRVISYSTCSWFKNTSTKPTSVSFSYSNQPLGATFRGSIKIRRRNN